MLLRVDDALLRGEGYIIYANDIVCTQHCRLIWRNTEKALPTGQTLYIQSPIIGIYGVCLLRISGRRNAVLLKQK